MKTFTIPLDKHGLPDNERMMREGLEACEQQGKARYDRLQKIFWHAILNDITYRQSQGDLFPNEPA